MESRSVVIIGLVLLITNLSIAQGDPNKSLEKVRLRKYQTMRDGGAAMVVVGAIMVTVGGVIELRQLDESLSTMFTGEPEKEYNNNGSIVFCSGAAILGAGIPLLIIGNRKYKLYKKSTDAISLGIKSHPQATGISLTYRF